VRALVTGAAGFIGSTLSAALLADGADVIGLDCFTDYYARSVKIANIAPFAKNARFQFVEDRLQTADLGPLLDGVTHVFHLAAQAGVRGSWGPQFQTYTSHNVDATQRLLEALKGRPISRLVYASSSSVYGDAAAIPMREDERPQPVSPYGVTKLAAEHLCHLYFGNYGVPAVALRYFTVYGPRQRPDMGFHRFIRAAYEARGSRDATAVRHAQHGAGELASARLGHDAAHIVVRHAHVCACDRAHGIYRDVTLDRSRHRPLRGVPDQSRPPLAGRPGILSGARARPRRDRRRYRLEATGPGT